MGYCAVIAGILLFIHYLQWGRHPEAGNEFWVLICASQCSEKSQNQEVDSDGWLHTLTFAISHGCNPLKFMQQVQLFCHRWKHCPKTDFLESRVRQYTIVPEYQEHPANYAFVAAISFSETRRNHKKTNQARAEGHSNVLGTEFSTYSARLWATEARDSRISSSLASITTGTAEGMSEMRVFWVNNYRFNGLSDKIKYWPQLGDVFYYPLPASSSLLTGIPPVPIKMGLFCYTGLSQTSWDFSYTSRQFPRLWKKWNKEYVWHLKIFYMRPT